MYNGDAGFWEKGECVSDQDSGSIVYTTLVLKKRKVPYLMSLNVAAAA